MPCVVRHPHVKKVCPRREGHEGDSKGVEVREEGQPVSHTSILTVVMMGYTLAYAGMAALSLGMQKHYAQLNADAELPSSRKVLFKTLGWGLLALALLPVIQGWSLAMGLVIWGGLISVAAINVVLVLAYQPRLLAWLGVAVSIALLVLLTASM